MGKYKLMLFFSILSLVIFKCETSGDGLVVYPGPYLGILRTGYDDPTPLGGDSGGDWFGLPNKGFYPKAAYPNPTNDQCTVGFQINKSKKIKIYLHHPVTKQTVLLYDNYAEAGVHSINIRFKQINLAKGFVRCYFNVEGSITYGDIFNE